MKGIYAALSVDLSDSAVVAAIQAWLPADSPPIFTRAEVVNQADGFKWYIPKSGSPYPAISGVSASQVKGGKVTLVAGTAAVVFTTPFTGSSDDLQITLGGTGDESLRFSSLTLAGFTITSGDGTSVSDVRWTATKYGNA